MAEVANAPRLVVMNPTSNLDAAGTRVTNTRGGGIRPGLSAWRTLAQAAVNDIIITVIAIAFVVAVIAFVVVDIALNLFIP